MSLAQPAEAKIVYTPAHVNVAFRQGYGINFDRNTIPEVYLSRSGDEGFSWVHAFISYMKSGGVAATQHLGGWTPAILPGAKIGPARHFATWRPMASVYSGYSRWYGPWANRGKGVKDRYLGVKFMGKDAYLHYGWARISVMTNAHNFTNVLLTGYAYETIPGKAIIAGATKGPEDAEPGALNTSAPEPGSLGVLALGAPGLSIWRREESVVATRKN